MEKRFTLETVMAWRPCYGRKKIAEWFAGRNSLTVADCLALPISDEDKLWCLLHPEVIPEAQLQELACLYVEHAPVRERDAGCEELAAAARWAEAARAEAWAARWAAGEAARWAAAAARAAGEAAGAAEIAWQLNAAVEAARDN